MSLRSPDFSTRSTASRRSSSGVRGNSVRDSVSSGPRRPDDERPPASALGASVPGRAGRGAPGIVAESRTSPSHPHATRELVGRGLTLVVLALVIGALIFAVPSLHQVRHDLGAFSLWWALAAIVLEVASCVSFVVLFRAFFDEIPAPLTRRVAWIEQGSGALLPGGGVTSYALGGVFLHREGMSVRRVIARSGGLFWFTSAVNAGALMLGTSLYLTGAGRTPRLIGALMPVAIAVPLTVLIAVSPLVVGWRWHSKPPPAWVSGLADGVEDAWRAARHPSWRLLAAVGYLGFDIAVLACLFRGLGYDVSSGALILGYLVGYCAAAIPVPAGIGVLEGGLVGALVLYGTPGAKTAAVVLLYHAVAFWVPSLGGLIAYLPMVRRIRRQASGAPLFQGTAP